MDKISLLKSRKDSLRQESSEVREKIATLIDADSFVELQSYSYSQSEFYGESAQGEGVVTGFATIDSNPCYVVAINDKVLGGGLGLGNCNKIVNCMLKAAEAGAPIIYLLSSTGILAGDGVDSLEGVAKLLSTAEQLKGNIPQFAICYGKVLGSATLLVALSDYTYYVDGACVAFNSPFVISAKAGTTLNEEKVGGAANGSGLCTFKVKDVAEARQGVINVLNVLPYYNGEYQDSNDDLNRNAENLNDKVCAKCLISAVFDNGNFIELGNTFAKEVVTGIGRVGGYSVASIIFNDENGVELTQENVEKVKNFLYYATDNGLPIVTFINTLGVKQDGRTNASTVLLSIGNLITALNYAADVPQINVITGKAIGLGYTLFASKAYGANYSFAFANSEVGAVSSAVGAEMEYAVNKGDKEELKEKFAQIELDPFKAAKGGYLDEVIEPQYVRQYLIAALQMLI